MQGEQERPGASLKAALPNERLDQLADLLGYSREQTIDYLITFFFTHHRQSSEQISNSKKTQKGVKAQIPVVVKKAKSITLTEEQNEILSLAKAKDDMIVNAYAGSGKTFILKKITEQLSKKKFMYLAFNKGLQIAASESFPKNTIAKTAHSLAWGGMNMSSHPMRSRLDLRMKTKDLATALRIKGDSALFLARAALQTANSFENSADYEISNSHIPEDVYRDGRKYVEAQAEAIIHYANLIWKDRLSSRGGLPITHNTYLKLWQMQGAKIPCSTLLFDEAQDANPVILDIVRQQDCRKIFVGDKYQQIYAWRGAVNALSSLGDGKRSYLSKSFRFGSPIAAYANRVLELKGETRPIRGVEDLPAFVGHEITLKKGESYAHLFRTNTALLLEAAELAQAKQRFAVLADIDDLLHRVRSTYALYKRRKQDVTHPAVLIYGNWDEIKEATKYDFELRYLTAFVEKFQSKCPDVTKKIEQYCLKNTLNAPTVLTTTHKAKGLEWENVLINDDFVDHLTLDEEEKMAKSPESLRVRDEEFNLIYVALTRATKNLCLPEGLDEALNSFKEILEPQSVII